MGTSKVYTYECEDQTFEDVFKGRVINSTLYQPVDLDFKLPERFLNKVSSSHLGAIKRKFKCAICCCFEALHTRKAIRPFEILDWLSGVHLMLSISTEDKSYIASGTVIASRYVLTAASNVFNREIDRQVDRRDIKILTQNDKGSAVSKANVIEIFYSKKYPLKGEEDFAMLVLDRDIGVLHGSIGLKVIEEEEALDKSLYLCGYETLEENKDEYHIKRHADLNANIFRGFNNCSIILSNLLIGSIFYYEESNRYYAIGILTSSAIPETLQVLHLDSYRIKKIESWIRKCPIEYSMIKSLNLSLFPYSTSKLLLKLQSLGASELLVSLDLSRNSLGPKGAKSLAKLTFKSLRSLNLERNDLGCKGAREIARGKLGKLTHLKLGENGICFKGAKDLAFGKLKYLMELHLQDNMIGDEGAIYLSRGNFTELKVLNLSMNGLGPITAKGIATGNLLNLRSLNLACNQIGSDGALILAKGNTAKLQELDVSSNCIGIEGAAVLSYGYRKLVNFKKLNLEKNNIRERTSARLSIGLTINPSVDKIQGDSIQDNRINSVSNDMNFI